MSEGTALKGVLKALRAYLCKKPLCQLTSFYDRFKGMDKSCTTVLATIASAFQQNVDAVIAAVDVVDISVIIEDTAFTDRGAAAIRTAADIRL